MPTSPSPPSAQSHGHCGGRCTVVTVPPFPEMLACTALLPALTLSPSPDTSRENGDPTVSIEPIMVPLRSKIITSGCALFCVPQELTATTEPSSETSAPLTES